MNIDLKIKKKRGPKKSPRHTPTFRVQERKEEVAKETESVPVREEENLESGVTETKPRKTVL